jgi:hypothetical protein
MTIRADAADEKIDAASFLNHLLVVLALCCKVRGIAIEDMDVLLRTVDVIEEVASHESVIALWMGFRQSDILVHVESEYVLERNFSGTVGLDECIVHAYR